MRVLFAGSSAIAIPSLQALCLEKTLEVVGVLTNADSPKGRGGKVSETEIAAAARNIGSNLAVLKPVLLEGEVLETVAALKPDILVCFAYGKIFKPEFMALFPLGGINAHPSLLPKYRGASPIQSAILNMESETGLSVQYVAKEVDSGDILRQETVPLSGRETAGELSQVMAQKAAQAFMAVLGSIARGKTQGVRQNHSEASYCRRISSEDARIDWGKSARAIDAQIRAFDGNPLCWTLHAGRKLFILKAKPLQREGGGAGLVLGADKAAGGLLVQTGDGALAAEILQYQAGKALRWQAFLNGARNFTGSVLE